MTYRWVSAATVKELVDLQKDEQYGISDSVMECVAAYRLFAAIDLWLQGDQTRAQDVLKLVKFDRFTDRDALLAIAARPPLRDEPFTQTCVAAHQQKVDFEKLRAGVDEETLTRIKVRHERYREAQIYSRS